MIVNPNNGKVASAKAYDGFETYDEMDKQIDVWKAIPEGHIIIAACNDECMIMKHMDARQFFADQGSSEIWDVTPGKAAWVFLGTKGRQDPMEKRATTIAEAVNVQQIFPPPYVITEYEATMEKQRDYTSYCPKLAFLSYFDVKSFKVDRFISIMR